MKKIIIIAVACVLLITSTTSAIIYANKKAKDVTETTNKSVATKSAMSSTCEPSTASSNGSSTTIENVTKNSPTKKTSGVAKPSRTTNRQVSGTKSVVYDGKTYTFPASKAERDAQARVIAKQIAAKCTSGSQISRADKASKLVYEYCKKCVYDNDYKTTIFREAYGVFIGGIYTCAGSASALGMVLDEMGIEWLHVNEGKSQHQWCAASLDGKDGWADAYIGQVGLGDYIFHNYYDPSLGMTVNEHDAILRAKADRMASEIRAFCTNELGLKETFYWEYGTYGSWGCDCVRTGGIEWDCEGDNAENKERLRQALKWAREEDPIYPDYNYDYFSISNSGDYVEIVGKPKGS